MPIRVIDFNFERAKLIELFGSVGARSVELASGSGESHVYSVHFAPGGFIGPHPAGFDQLFLIVQGSGWVAGSNGKRTHVPQNCAAFIPSGEIHSKGSETGLVAIMLQAGEFVLAESR